MAARCGPPVVELLGFWMVNALMMRIVPWHFVQTRGSVSYTFRMKYDQRLFNSLETGGGGLP